MEKPRQETFQKVEHPLICLGNNVNQLSDVKETPNITLIRLIIQDTQSAEMSTANIHCTYIICMSYLRHTQTGPRTP